MFHIETKSLAVYASFYDAIKAGTKKTLEFRWDKHFFAHDVFQEINSGGRTEILLIGPPRTYPTFREYLEKEGLANIPGASTVDEGIELLTGYTISNPAQIIHVCDITPLDKNYLEKRVTELKNILLKTPACTLIAVPFDASFLFGCCLQTRKDIDKIPFLVNPSKLAYLAKGLSLTLDTLHILKDLLFFDGSVFTDDDFDEEENPSPQIIFSFNPVDSVLGIRVRIERYPVSGPPEAAFDKGLSDTQVVELVNLLYANGFRFYPR